MDISDFAGFQPKHSFRMDFDDFSVVIATTVEDLQKAQRLRHKVFFEEGLGKTHDSGLEFDHYDIHADHLMIIDKQTDEAVGTYRLISSEFSNIFYSQSEFNIDGFLKIDGIKLEMGRACTHMDFRNGRTMDLLWQGISKYISDNHVRYLFGCSSVKTTDPQEMFSLLKAISEKDQLKRTYNIHPVGDFEWPRAEELFSQAMPMPGFTKQLPPLLRSYLNAGSFVHGMPAYDKDFLCFDLLTILDLAQLNKKFKARFLPDFSI